MAAIAVLAVLACAPAVKAQDPQNFAAAGASVSQGSGAAWLNYSRNLGGGTWVLMTSDQTLVNIKTFQFQRSIRTEAGYDVTALLPSSLRLTRLHLIGLGGAGLSGTSSALGSAFAGGGFGTWDMGERAKHLQFVGGARVLKTSTAGTQVVVEFGIGHGF